MPFLTVLLSVHLLSSVLLDLLDLATVYTDNLTSQSVSY